MPTDNDDDRDQPLLGRTHSDSEGPNSDPDEIGVGRRPKTLVSRKHPVWTHKQPSNKRGDKNKQPPRSNKSEDEVEWPPLCAEADVGNDARPVACMCTAESYDMQAIFAHCTARKMRPTIFDDVVHVAFDIQGQHLITVDPDRLEGKRKFDAFFFPYGVFVCWGVGEQAIAAIRREMNLVQFETKPLDAEDFEEEEFDFTYGKKFYIDRLKDEIVLMNELTRDEDILGKVAISHGLALSLKLGVFEEAIEKTVQETKHLPEDLACHGTIHMSSKEISRIIGELFIQRNSVNLHSDILDVPDFFWENSELEPLYAMTRSYLDLNKRVEILNKRLDVLKELLEILKDQLNTQHASRLEWFVIWLILLELMITLVWDILVKDLNAFGLCSHIRCDHEVTPV